MNYVFTADGAYTPETYLESPAIAVRDERIVYIGTDLELAQSLVPDAVRKDFPGCTAVPGFVDLHVHGALGWDFYDCPPSRIGEVADFFARRGTTAFLAAVTTGSPEQMRNSIANLAEYISSPRSLGAKIAGIYLEGPFCSYARRGTFRPEYLLAPDWRVIEPWVDEFGQFISFVGLAPELPGAEDIIRRLHARGVGTCICHSDAGHGELERAKALGTTHLTHFFNGMRPLHHRDPGLVGGALARGGVSAELICDLHHVRPEAIEIVMRCLGPGRVCLITDAMRAAGCPPGEYEISEQQAVVRDGKALIGEATLAGSVLTMDQAVRNMLSLGYREADVFTMAAKTPARIAGLARRGELRPGNAADLVFLDSRYRVSATVVAGTPIYSHGKEPAQ